MEFLTDYTLIASFFSLTLLEIVLGIDNIVFLALLVQHLPDGERVKARNIAIVLAFVMRLALLFGVAWVISLTKPFISIFDHSFSGKDLMMFAGGLFLIAKATSHIHEMFSHEKEVKYGGFTKGFVATIFQAVMIDIVFSFDSVITAIGITKVIPIIIAAMAIAMIFMLFSVRLISDFVKRYPTLKVLALCFILLIGILLMTEGFGLHIPRGYIYSAMAFSMFVETINILAGKRRNKKNSS